MNYEDFLKQKLVRAERSGFDVAIESLNPMLFEWQRRVVQWALKQGKAGLFLDTGLGKTGVSLEWSSQVANYTNGNVLILTPLAVAHQFVKEGKKFGIDCEVSRDGKYSKQIVVTNYEMLKHFDVSDFAGVYLDESDILANYTGKVKQQIISAFRQTPYKLCGSATPSPNTLLELGNQSDFLDVMAPHEMITRWFINNTMKAGDYRLKHHARADFWQWVASWAVCISKPSDIGYPNDGYILPGLNIRQHVVEVDHSATWDSGQLVRTGNLSSTDMHREMRLTADDRAAAVAEIITNSADSPWVIWVNTDYEADAIRALLPNVVEVKGSDSVKVKEERLEAFSAGQIEVLLTKPKICSYGLNWQHCHNTAFMGLSYSFKQLYQALRRFYRFGQTQVVNAHIVTAETEGSILQAIQRKQEQHAEMQREMCVAMAQTGLLLQESRKPDDYNPQVLLELPSWLKSKAAA